MRRADREITAREEMVEVLKECDVMRLAFRDGEVPYILPLNFGMEEQGKALTFYFHGAREGYKYELIAREGRASFEADCKHRLVYDEVHDVCTMEYLSVIGRGKVSLVEEEGEVLHALALLMAHYGREQTVFRKEVVAMTRVFKLEVESMTGKRRMKTS